MAKILVHVTNGPENPTRAALAFLVTKSAIDEGHSVSMFLAGDAVQLMRKAVLDNLAGLGTGELRTHFDAIVPEADVFTSLECQARAVVSRKKTYGLCRQSLPRQRYLSGCHWNMTACLIIKPDLEKHFK